LVVLLYHRQSSRLYLLFAETIISWTDPEVSTDLALSFQETMGCNYIWEQVCSVQRQIQFPSVGLAEGPRQLSEELEHSGTSQEEGERGIRGFNRCECH
jgi:protein phosphatase-4 regulatory subunit 3